MHSLPRDSTENAGLREFVAMRYETADYPALDHQRQRWRQDRPLAGLSVLDATPAFANTTVKYLALQAAGAQVTVSPGRGIPSDYEVVRALPRLGIRVADRPGAFAERYDVVFDCAGTHADVSSRFGYVELTESGRTVYHDSSAPVYLADAGRVKRIETSLGTGDGFLRALAASGFGSVEGHRVVVFGGGKVGSGIARLAAQAGALVTLVDPASPVVPGCVTIAWADRPAVESAIASAWCVVTATGRRAALAPLAPLLTAGDAVLANMGAEDEFGPDVPESRVLHGKRPANFLLEEPTHLRYIEPTLAVSNACGLLLARGQAPALMSPPPPVVEDQVIADVLATGTIAGDVLSLFGESAA